MEEDGAPPRRNPLKRASSPADADRIEERVQKIWAKNASLGRARVHRNGTIIVGVWNAPAEPACWEAVNEAVAERLAAL